MFFQKSENLTTMWGIKPKGRPLSDEKLPQKPEN